MKKKIIISVLLLSLIIIGSILFVNIKNNKIKEQNKKRYEEIKNDIDTELKRYMYVIAPKCYPENGTPLITHRDLVYNGGMDKEKFLDIDKKSYCKAYIKTKCIEVGTWDWDIMISCKNYTDDGYVDWDKEFESTN